MLMVFAAFAAVWFIGSVMGATARLRLVLIGLIWALVVLSLMVLPEGPLRQALGGDMRGWLVLGGVAALALAYRQGRLFMEQIDAAKVLPALYLPTPRVELGIALRGIATSAIDISDGLLGDLGHILKRSHVGAVLEFATLPTLPVAQAYLHEKIARDCVLAGGDDYELCFTAPADRRDAVIAAAKTAGVAVTRIGRTTAEPGLTVIGSDGQPMPFEHTGYDHFAA